MERTGTSSTSSRPTGAESSRRISQTRPPRFPAALYLDAKHLTLEQIEAIGGLGWHAGRNAMALCDYPEFVFADDVLSEMLTDEEFDVRYREANQ